jgi:hypothetical protein
MLEALKLGHDRAMEGGGGSVGGDRGVKKALVHRGLANWNYDGQGNQTDAYITENGLLLIRTQYEALKQVLPAPPMTRSEFK